MDMFKKNTLIALSFFFHFVVFGKLLLPPEAVAGG